MKTITYNEQTHRLVSVEPTEGMIRVACLNQCTKKYESYDDWWNSHTTGISERIRMHIKSDYQAMLSAAPQPEPVEVEPVAKVDMSDEGQWADILPDRSVKLGQLLYTAPPSCDACKSNKQDYEEIKRQRDVLAKALEKTLPSINDIRDLQAARAALASVKGGV